MGSALAAPAHRGVVAGSVLLIVNPAAAAVTRDLVAAVAARISPLAERVRIATTGHAGHAANLVADATAAGDVAVVVVLGGDGTVREAAEGLIHGVRRARLDARDGAGSGPTLLALPAGSGNSFCRNVWGELDCTAVLDQALDPARGRLRRLDVIQLAEPGVLSALGASSGFLADVLVAAEAVTGLAGRQRYYAAAASVLAAMPAYPIKVMVDGVTVHYGPACAAAVGGGRYRAHDFAFLPRSVLDDGLLDVCVIGELTGAAVTELTGLVVGGDHLNRPEVRYARGRRVCIERLDGAPLVAEYDGEVWPNAGRTLTMEVVPGAVPVLAPLTPPAG